MTKTKERTFKDLAWEAVKEAYIEMGIPQTNVRVRPVSEIDKSFLVYDNNAYMNEDESHPFPFFDICPLNNHMTNYLDEKFTIYRLHNPSDIEKVTTSTGKVIRKAYLSDCELLYPTEEHDLLTFQAPKEGDDIPFSSLTARDYACILLQQPATSKQWLNKLINETKKS